jgi:ribose-phosphate pyrophosphokinase
MEQLFNEEESGQVYIAGGFAHPELTAQIAESVGIYPGPLKEKIHPNGEIYVRYEDSVRGNHVFVIQSHVGAEGTSVNDAIMEQCLMIDAAKRSSAKEITAVAPYLAYGRQDRKTKGREPIAAAVILNQLAAAGADRIVTVDMHSSQTQGIFQGPFDHLTAQPLLRDAMKEEIAEYERDDCIVVAPDAGAAKLSEQHRTDLDMGMFVMTKLRDPNDNQKISRDDKFPDADGRVCLVFDDMVDTAGTLVSAAEALNNSGAKAVYVAATHGVLSDPALERLKNAPIKKILITDTFVTERAQKELGDKLRIVSVAPMIGRAIIEIVRCGSVSEIFQDQNNR